MEQIVEAAFEIAKAEGMDSITIRKVADYLGSSIAPIYVNFEDVEQLKQEVVLKIVELSHQLLRKQNSGNPFHDMGVASLKMALEYPVLFRDLVMKQNEYLHDYEQQMGDNLVGLMKADSNLKGLTDEELMTILLKMKIFQTGLCVMVANGFLPSEFTEEMMIDLLDSAATDVIVATNLRNKGEI